MYKFQFLMGLLLLPAVAGCGNDLASVNGRITLDGQPIVGGKQNYGTVSFYREEGGGAPAVALIDESGQYSLRTGGQSGIEPGTYLVGIAVKKIRPPVTPGEMPQAELITPRRYASVTQSGFREVVEPGNNTIDFELISKQVN
jgi:hypothetical protein